MPPQLALIICTIFVLFLLHLDHKQSPDVSFVLWIPTIWMLLIASKPLGIWFGVGGGDVESGSPLDRNILSALLCLGLAILVIKKFNWSDAIKENVWIVLIIGYMLISILWSEIPYISFKRWIKQFVAVVMAFIVATDPDPRKALESLFRRTIYVLIPFSYILIHYFSKYGRLYTWSGEVMWTGVSLHKNSLCRLSIISALFLIFSLVRRWQGRDIPVAKYQTPVEVSLLILTLYLLGGPQHSFTHSATSITALSAGLLALIILYWMKKRGNILNLKILIVIIAFIIGYGTVTPMLGRLSLLDISSTFGRDESLTGRTDIWARLVPIAMRQPILGHGVGGFWTTETTELLTVNEAHNGYLEIITELGFVGLLLISMFLLSSCCKSKRVILYDFDWGALWICYLLMAVIFNITESSINSLSNHQMAVVLFLSVSYTKPQS